MYFWTLANKQIYSCAHFTPWCHVESNFTEDSHYFKHINMAILLAFEADTDAYFAGVTDVGH